MQTSTRRMTAQSRRNLQAADRIEIRQSAGAWWVKVWVGELPGVAFAGDGLIMLYDSPAAAERAARRLSGAPISYHPDVHN